MKRKIVWGDEKDVGKNVTFKPALHCNIQSATGFPSGSKGSSIIIAPMYYVLYQITSSSLTHQSFLHPNPPPSPHTPSVKVEQINCQVDRGSLLILCFGRRSLSLNILLWLHVIQPWHSINIPNNVCGNCFLRLNSSTYVNKAVVHTPDLYMALLQPTL